MWATTSGAARNGVFHPYREPKTPFEKAVSNLGISLKKIQRVDTIDTVLNDRGLIGGARGWITTGQAFVSDGKKEVLPGTNFYEWYYDVNETIHVTGATYVVCYNIASHTSDYRYATVEKIVLTADADEDKVIAELQKLRDFR